MSTMTLPAYGYREPITRPTWRPPHRDLTRPPAAPPPLPDDLLTADGGEAHIKATCADGCSELAGWAIRYGSDCSLADAHGDLFSEACDFDLDPSTNSKSVRLLWHHRMDKAGPRGVIGRAMLQRRPEGLWANIKLAGDLPAEFRAKVGRLARSGRLFLSTGTAAHLAERSTKAGSCRSIDVWPVIELSITESPASRACSIDPASVKGAGVAPRPDLLDRVRKLIGPAKVRPDPAFLESLRRQVEHTKAFLAESEAERDRSIAEFEAWREEQARLDAEAKLPGLIDRVRDLLDDAPAPAAACDCGCAGATGCKAALPEPYLPVDGLAFACWAALEETPHLDGLSFAKSCDFGDELEAGEPVLVPLLAHHDARRVIGVARLTRHDAGLWMEALADADADAAKSLLVAGWGGPGEPVGVSTRCSSGADRGGEIYRWVPSEASILRTPADPALKALRPAAVVRVDVMGRYRRAARRTEADMEPLRPGTWGSGDFEHRFMQLKAEALDHFRDAGLAGFGVRTP